VKIFDDVYRGRRVLVTGHTGFKGSWLAQWLLNLGAEVAGYSVDIPSQPSNFDLLQLNRKIRHYVGDIRDQQRLAAAMDEFKPDVVFHMAAQALVRRSYMDPVNTFETNAMGMVHLLECVRQRDWIKAVVLITSDKAYRNDEWCWGYREIDALGGYDPYSASKSCADLIAQSYIYSFLRESKTRIAITRAGNVIGGGDWADDRIVPDCVRAWSKGELVAIRSPKSTRPWQHVLEPLSGYLWLGAGLLQGAPGLNGEAFNFGPEAKVNQTVADLLDAMTARWQGTRWEVSQGFENQGHEATLLKLSCDKALSHLKWSATLDFQDTVVFTVDWYRSWHQEGQANMADYTDAQIMDYCTLAVINHAIWVQA
jgi:CDP-glucose 4,6-dehydratase